MTSPQLTQAEELLRSNKHRDAKSVLLQSSDRLPCLAREYGYYCILWAEACLYIGDYAFDCLDEAIDIFRFDKDSLKYARAKYLKGWQQAALGRHHEAEETLIESYAAYTRCQDLAGAARVLNRLSYVLLQLGKLCRLEHDDTRRCGPIGQSGLRIARRKCLWIRQCYLLELK